jgi:hypothetical protein
LANLILIQASLTGQPLAEAAELTGRLNKVELKAGFPDSIGSVDPDPDPESGSGSRRAKMTHKSRIFFLSSCLLLI